MQFHSLSQNGDGRWGLIPPFHDCPVRKHCPQGGDSRCNHQGTQHTVWFSCGLARLIDTLPKQELKDYGFSR
jgi:hypothetical protein